mmetsp:Transcript_158150/g.295049  ORF Transcript_158150/g.295049 Transcript_158150/m.295049 type:complete len:90 (+) Transcript_158150:296-565(+)
MGEMCGTIVDCLWPRLGKPWNNQCHPACLGLDVGDDDGEGSKDGFAVFVNAAQLHSHQGQVLGLVIGMQGSAANHSTAARIVADDCFIE